MPKKSSTKKSTKRTAKKSASIKKGWASFSEWWSKVAQKKVDKIERSWLKENEPNDPEDDGGGDHWHVNEMMHSGDAHEMTAEIAERVFEQGRNGEKWEFDQSDSLYCDLDSVIVEAYEAGKSSKGRKA